MNIEPLSQQFCDYSRYMRGYSPDTIRRYRETIHLLQVLTGITQLDECTEAKVREFFFRGRIDRKWTPSSFATYHKGLVVFFRWCVERGFLGANPTDGIEVPKTEKTLPAKLNKQDALRLLDAVANYQYRHRFQRVRNHAILATALYAGLRKKELLRLQLAHVDIENRSILVRHGKGGKDRVVPMSAALAGILAAYLEERARAGKTCPEFFTSHNHDMGLTEEGMKRLVTHLSRLTGIRFTLHKLRHTFATLLLEGGCDIFSLSKMMGHSDIKTTTIYLAATPEHLRGQMAKHPLNYA